MIGEGPDGPSSRPREIYDDAVGQLTRLFGEGKTYEDPEVVGQLARLETVLSELPEMDPRIYDPSCEIY